MPVYDPDSMHIAAGQVEKLKDEFEKSKQHLTGMDHENESPFGKITGGQDAHGAVGHFKQGVHDEFDAAGRLMEATGGVLRKAAQMMAETEQAAADEVKRYHLGDQ